MADDAYTYGHAFRAAGYATGFFGVCHSGYLPEQSPLKRGFDEFAGLCGGMDHHSHVTRWGKPNWWQGDDQADEPGYSTDLITNHALDFLERHRDRPLCLHVADFLVHFPWQGPNDQADFAKGSVYDCPEHKYGRRRDRRTAYREMVEAMDRSVGRLVARVDELGLTENTLLLFAADHGGHHMVADNGPLSGAKGSLLEGGHRIPAIACWPGRLPAGRAVDDTAMLMDLFPTFSGLCNLPAPPGTPFDGTDLCRLLLGSEPLPERTLFWRQGDARAARRGPWKLVADPAAGVRLFHLPDDIGETRDVSSRETDTRDSLMRALERWETGIPPPPSL
jgi:arylsulfatase A-like enzyme